MQDTITVNGETIREHGCYIDGHWGQYAERRLCEIADDIFGNGSPYTFTFATEHGHYVDTEQWDIAHEYADDVLALLNDATKDGSWEWYDGELFLQSDRTWSVVHGEPWWDEDGYRFTRADALWYLTHDEDGNDIGHLLVPCSPYGRTTDDVAPVAWRYAYLVARETGEGVTTDDLHHAMSAVVNDHDDVRYIVRKYGHRHYR